MNTPTHPMSNPRWSACDVSFAAQLACLLEASAPKPGNVSPGRAFRDAHYEDFLASAVAIGPAFAASGETPLGRTIGHAIQATARHTRSNTNLGIVLLLAPLARAALLGGSGDLRAQTGRVLAATTVDDAAEAYEAIRLARPGGLASAPEQDLAGTPTVSLREAMLLAADRDAVAHEYATDFATTFELGAPALARARHEGLSWSDATLECYLVLLGAAADTLVARKLGTECATRISRRARSVLAVGGVRTHAGRVAVAELDRELRESGNSRNPGATADLTAAALFVHLLEGGWPSPGEHRYASGR